MLSNVWLTSAKVASGSPNQLDAFKRGLATAIEYINANPDEARKILTSFTELDPALAREMLLPKFESEFDVDAIERVDGPMREFGYIDKDVDIEAALYKAAE